MLVTAEFQSIARWQFKIPRTFVIGAWTKATSSSSGDIDAGYMSAKEGDQFLILHVGTTQNDADWLFVESASGDPHRGWIKK